MGLLDHLKAGGEVGKGVVAPGVPASAPGALDGTSLGNSLATLFAKSTAPAVQAVSAVPKPVAVPALVQVLRAEEASTPSTEPDLMTEGGDDVLDANGEGMGVAAEGVSFGINPPDAAPADLQKDTVEKKTRKKREKKMDEVLAQPEPAVERYLEAVAGPKVEELKTFLSTPRKPAPAGTLLERIERLEQSTGSSTAGDTSSLEDRLDRLEARIARIEEAVGL